MEASRAITTSTVDVGGVPVFVRRRDGVGDPVVFSHGNPTHSADWLGFMERLDRPAIAFDLPGWGRTPAARGLDFSMHGLARFFGRTLEALGVGRHALVVHDWGGLALIDAQTHPERLDRLVVVNAVPLLPGYRWHWIARWFWRRPVLGELFNLTATKFALRQITRQATPRPGPLPDEFVDMVWETWPRGINRPLLELYRSGDPEALAAAGAGLGALDVPSLVVWAAGDPYIDARFGQAYAERLGGELLNLDGAGHWPWIERPDMIDRVAEFLEG